MFCPRAMSVVFGVSVCALLSGCATQSPAVPITQKDQAEPMESALAENRGGAEVLSSDTLSAATTVRMARPVSREEIIEWSIRGFSDDMIIDRIDHSSCAFPLSTSEEIHLRDAGVSDEVVRAMKATGG